jgi:hypothetical protein
VLLSAINASYSDFFNYEKKGDKTIGSLKAEVTASHVEEYIRNIEKLLLILQQY